MNKNWGQNDPNYNDNLRVALFVRSILIEKQELLKKKQETIKILETSNDTRLSQFDYVEEKELQKMVELFKTKFDPFKIVNSNPDLLNEQIDLHGGLGKEDA